MSDSVLLPAYKDGKGCSATMKLNEHTGEQAG